MSSSKYAKKSLLASFPIQLLFLAAFLFAGPQAYADSCKKYPYCTTTIQGCKGSKNKAKCDKTVFSSGYCGRSSGMGGRHLYRKCKWVEDSSKKRGGKCMPDKQATWRCKPYKN